MDNITWPIRVSQNSVEWAQKKGLIEELKSTTGKAKLLQDVARMLGVCY